MRFFDLLDFQYLILAIFLGLVSAVLIYLGFQSYSFSRKGKKEEEEIEDEFPGGIRVQNHSIPPFLIFVVIGFILWAIAYVVLYGLWGQPF